MAKDKSGKEETKEETGKTVRMIWLHKKATPGSMESVFGLPGVANEEGFLVVDVPKERVKNEMKRAKTLVPVELYEKKKALDEESANLFR